MSKGLFQSPKKALLFVGMTMFSVAMLVGPEGDEGALIQAAESLDSSQKEFDIPPITERETTPARQQRRIAQEEQAWTPDEELIDTAEGFDPTPEIEKPYEPETDLGASDMQVVRVETGDRAGQDQF